MSWEHRFHTQLELSARQANQALPAFHFDRGCSPQYRALTPPDLAARDALNLDRMLRADREVVDLWEPHSGFADSHHRLQLYDRRERSLDEIIPFLQNLGLRVIDQVQSHVDADDCQGYIRSFEVVPADSGGANLMGLKAPLLEALDALLQGLVENDALNGLLLRTGLAWREIDVFRAYRNYYFQLGSRFGRFRFHQALLAHPECVRLLFRYFEHRFKPDPNWSDTARREEEVLFPVRMELAAALNTVADASEDRILRDLFNLIDATLRTDFYRPRDADDNAIALKISSLGVINCPNPRPLFEIYVHSPLMEGIHLRGAKVARGGIRWSDRPDDFRSEILDLMLTQMVKNTLIVPQGAKGGFVLNPVERNGTDRFEYAKRAYGMFIRGLLNLTDNRVGDAVQSPADTTCYDDADPYLVVAADKGTARLSDHANGIAAEYGFWLGDAFASGGSHGYHHKRLGITARGAFVCVTRHFREAGQHIGTAPFTVVGVGSMDGDVFGNGMLWSENIRLLAAFNATHIFLDPDPDPAISFMERKRLFDLPGSGWNDYDPRLISSGGGVFSRNAKDIPLVPKVRQWLGVHHASMDGEGLIRQLLMAPVDLLWLGGIGTYVRAGSETDDEVADRSNDPVRVEANRLRAKVVGEGANLGFTQKARVEYALAGGRIDTDAVDNSGGVDLSDHEVNLKILMASLRQRGLIASEDERNRWLERISGDVVRSVLANNDAQSLCLSLDQERGARDPEPFLELADRLVNAGLLDRTVESFPTRKALAARLPQQLVRPELAVLMAYGKLALKRALLEAGDFLREPWTFELLAAYFPAPIRESFGEHPRDHSLAAEITATVLCNRIIGQAGASFLTWVDELEPAPLAGACAAYVAYDRIVGGPGLREKIHALDGRMPAARQYALLLRLEDMLASFCRWTLLYGEPPSLAADLVEARRTRFREYLDFLAAEAEGPDHERVLGEFGEWGLAPEELRLLACPRPLDDFPALVDLAGRTGVPLAEVAGLHDAVSERLNLRRSLLLLKDVKPRDRWERRAQTALGDRFRSGLRALAEALLRSGSRDTEAFFGAPEIQPQLVRYDRLEHDFIGSATVSLIPFVALSAALEALRDACIKRL